MLCQYFPLVRYIIEQCPSRDQLPYGNSHYQCIFVILAQFLHTTSDEIWAPELWLHARLEVNHYRSSWSGDIPKHVHKVRVRNPKSRKKKSLPSQSGRSRTGKYWDGAWTEAHTSHRHSLRTRSPCYGEPPQPTSPGRWRSLCHQGKYEVCGITITRFYTLRCLCTDHITCHLESTERDCMIRCCSMIWHFILKTLPVWPLNQCGRLISITPDAIWGV